MKKYIKIAGVLATLLIIFEIFMLVAYDRTTILHPTITGTVSEVNKKSNESENGFYFVTIKDKSGKNHKIDATGYMNTWVSPDSQGEACVYVPDVKIGDNVTFRLPKAQSKDSNFQVCYEKSLAGFYFKAQ